MVTIREFEGSYSDLVSDDTPKSREEFLDRLITRKLLLLEAKRQGLDQQKDFLASVKNFWEQALLRLVVSKKTTEIAATTLVSDEELEQAVQDWISANPNEHRPSDELREALRRQILRKKQNRKFEDWVAQLRRNASVEVNRKAVGLP